MLNFLNPIEEHYTIKHIDGILTISKQMELYCNTVHAKSLKQVFEIYFNYLNRDEYDIEHGATINAWCEKLDISPIEFKIKLTELYNSILLDSPEKLI